MIPAILSQTWKSDQFPADLARLKKGWEQRNPEFAHRFYDDQGCREVVAEAFPDFIDDYDRLPLPIMKADVFRYAVIYRDGGVYADMDMECLRPIGKILRMGSCLLSEEAHLGRRRQADLQYRRPFQIANCIFAAAPKHPFFKAAFERAFALFRALPANAEIHVEDLTGPRMLTRLHEEIGGTDITILPQIMLMAPLDYPNIWPINRFMYARHLTFGTWKGDAETQSLGQRLIARNRPPNPVPPQNVRRKLSLSQSLG